MFGTRVTLNSISSNFNTMSLNGKDFLDESSLRSWRFGVRLTATQAKMKA